MRFAYVYVLSLGVFASDLTLRPAIAGQEASAPAAAERENLEDCAPFQSAARALNARQGLRIDRWTSLLRVDVSCSDRVIVFHQRLTVPESVLKAGWKEHMQERWTRLHCSGQTPFSEGALHGGWTVAATLEAGGAVSTILAQCKAPEA